MAQAKGRKAGRKEREGKGRKDNLAPKLAMQHPASTWTQSKSTKNTKTPTIIKFEEMRS